MTLWSSWTSLTYNGETPTTDGLYTVVEFLTTGEFVTPAGVTEADAEICLVAGGGAGGTWCGGGGGAGGVLIDTVTLTGTMEVIIGDGAPGMTANGDGGDGADEQIRRRDIAYGR